MIKLLIVEDETIQRKNLSAFLRKKKYYVDEADSVEKAIEKIDNNLYSVIISDMKLNSKRGEDILDHINKMQIKTIFIIITAYASLEESVEIVKKGAFDYISKPINLDDLEYKIKRAANMMKIQTENTILKETLSSNSNIIYKSKIMQNILDIAYKTSKTKAPVLITGESGTGKELIAKLIHDNSERKDNLFVAVNCGALNENLLESELFGYEKGAFTGADKRKIGRFEIADDGTIFLDEIGEISNAMQVKLLRVLQEGEFERVGGTKTIKSNVRLIVATNKNLDEMVKKREFRDDLYFRINVINIELPPLRQRIEDIPLLIKNFIEKYNVENNRNIKEITVEAMEELEKYDFPGNIRELQNIIQRAIILNENTIIDKDDLIIRKDKKYIINTMNMEQSIINLEKKMIIESLKRRNYSIKRSANELNITERQLRYKIEKYNIRTS